MSSRHRNMTRRKPVPQLSPTTTTVSPLTTPGPERPSLSIMTKEDLPPLPMEVCEKMERTSVDDRRHAIYLPESLPPSPPPKDGSAAGSRPESLVATLVDGMEVREDTAFAVPPPLRPEPQRVDSRALPQPTPEVRKRASQKSLPKIYRPPTPPIPAQHPKLRSGGHSRTSSPDSQTLIVRRVVLRYAAYGKLTGHV
ncbi:hypothetical protein GSI_00803 [Ganoderma sinense ZZ0214-1]|uniref:Uncharacterized protein n=1 Tax=Ganoderma sinense ZZ0214-1 TaxID=1077348 RepID=A0A2G8STK6_9APHY|nr:hypothetical protein GSI_00803 [Ganoderma sinense ZZ0214-1]